MAIDIDALRADLRRHGVSVTLAGMLRAQDAAAFLGKSHRTLRNWRSAGSGPPYTSIGGSIFYPLKDLAAFVEAGANRPRDTRTSRNELSRKRRCGEDNSMQLQTSRLETRLPLPVADAIRSLAKTEGTTIPLLIESALRSYEPIVQAMKSGSKDGRPS